MIKKVFFVFIAVFALSSMWNAYYSIISFISSNLTIRESYAFTNDVKKKGTHWGAKKYYSTHRKHKIDLITFNYVNIINSFYNTNNIDKARSNFKKEFFSEVKQEKYNRCSIV